MLPSFCRALVFPLLIVVAASSASAKLTSEQLQQLPPPAARQVDFAKDIQPIFETTCAQCHARGKNKGGFSLETRKDFLEGGDSGPPAVAGHSADSFVVELISGLSTDSVMPKKGKKLTRDQVGIFRAWIDQGMRWPESITFFKHEPANLKPNEAALARVSAQAGANPFDAIVEEYFANNHLASPPVVDDRKFARRVWLDAIGLLPTPTELDAFVADRTADKRAQLVQRLLADNQRYAENWLSFWNDLLRNDYKGTGYTDGGRKQITSWLYTALARNIPYNRFVAELIDPGVEAEGFTNGILWRGAVNASMVPPMQAAQGISQVFLGVNLKCASCHDSFINEYTLADSYGLASIYNNGPLEIAECDKPTGHIAKVKFLYDELGAIDTKADAPTRKHQLADVLTGRKNGRLARTIVNRLWQRFLGYGLVEPVDEMDKPAWSPAMIDWLAEDLVAHGYDLKQTMARILTSRAYQLPAVGLGETTENFFFRGPAVRRLTAEQFEDAIYSVTGQMHPKLDGKLNRLAALNPQHAPLPVAPKWIWATANAEVKAAPATYVFHRVVTLPSAPTEAHFAVTADDNYAIKINGKNGGSSVKRNGIYADWIDVKSLLQAGENTIDITVVNLAPDEGRLVSVKTDARPNPDSPAGLLLYARVRTGNGDADFASDRAWTVKATENGAGEISAVELGGVELAPWKVGAHFMETAAVTRDALPVARASLVFNDPLMAALGRPNREQVVTVRQATPTTLQALELTNGGTLATLLKRGSDAVLSANPRNTPALVTDLYQRSLSRAPTSAERAIAEKLVTSPPRCDGVEDLLWAITMLPEFQLIQ